MICGIHLSVFLAIFLCFSVDSTIASPDGIYHHHDVKMEFEKKSEFLGELLDRLPQKEWKQANDDDGYFKRFRRSVDEIVDFFNSALGRKIVNVVVIVKKYRQVFQLIIKFAKIRSSADAFSWFMSYIQSYIQKRNEQYRNSILRDIRQHMDSIKRHINTMDDCFEKIERLFKRSDGETMLHEDFAELQKIIRQIEIEIEAANRNLNDVENDLKNIEKEIERLDAHLISSCLTYAGVSVTSGIGLYALSVITRPPALLIAAGGSMIPCFYSVVQHLTDKEKIQSDLASWQRKRDEMASRLKGYEKRWEELKTRFEHD